MRSMKEQLSSMGEKLIANIGETSIKITEQALGKCIILGLYEPKIPMEVLKETMNTKE
ncbi:MAG: cyclic lactone autoinducer peptide [Bacillota bacterium]|nr:cyclic lactone autoinducer peptide [Bacillota bacterium]